MGIKEYDTEDEIDDAFEKDMNGMQEEARLRELISDAEERVEIAYDEWLDAKEKLESLNKQLEQLGV